MRVKFRFNNPLIEPACLSPTRDFTSVMDCRFCSEETRLYSGRLLGYNKVHNINKKVYKYVMARRQKALKPNVIITRVYLLIHCHLFS